MPLRLTKKLKIQTLVTDRKRSGEARAVLPLKATALTQTVQAKEKAVCTVLPLKATMRTRVSVKGRVTIRENEPKK